MNRIDRNDLDDINKYIDEKTKKREKQKVKLKFQKNQKK